MTIVKSVRDNKYVVYFKGYYFREQTLNEALEKMLNFITSKAKV